ncbi:hypothetical protein G6F59_017471 [Rhizopus arrhizus]|nr:hypothetical protein G6F59_017471 [Rhizopus arrhizus]
MMSMSGGWFFLVAAEAISVSGQDIKLPGIGSYIAVAIQAEDGRAIAWAIGAMMAGILLRRRAAVVVAGLDAAQPLDAGGVERVLGVHAPCAGVVQRAV